MAIRIFCPKTETLASMFITFMIKWEILIFKNRNYNLIFTKYNKNKIH